MSEKWTATAELRMTSICPIRPAIAGVSRADECQLFAIGSRKSTVFYGPKPFIVN